MTKQANLTQAEFIPEDALKYLGAEATQKNIERFKDWLDIRDALVNWMRTGKIDAEDRVDELKDWKKHLK